MQVPDIAKLDVQGFELEVHRGADCLFGATEVFLLETSLYKPMGAKTPLVHDVLGFMLERGYLLYDIIGFYRRRKDHCLAQSDMVFVKESSPLRRCEPLAKEHHWDWGQYFDKA